MKEEEEKEEGGSLMELVNRGRRMQWGKVGKWKCGGKESFNRYFSFFFSNFSAFCLTFVFIVFAGEKKMYICVENLFGYTDFFLSFYSSWVFAFFFFHWNYFHSCCEVKKYWKKNSCKNSDNIAKKFERSWRKRRRRRRRIKRCCRCGRRWWL